MPWSNTFRVLKDTHDDAFKAVDRAIKLEELEKPDLALQEYKKAVTLIDRALALSVEPPETLDDTWEEGCRLVERMKSGRDEILVRVAAVDKTLPPVEVNAVETRPRTYEELAQALREMHYTQMESAKYLELLFSCDGVKFYRIQTSGEVTTENEESTLRIVRIEKDDEKGFDSTVFLQVLQTSQTTRIENVEEPLMEISEPGSAQPSEDKSWIYPLIPGVSPCYRTEYGAFIFPDLELNDGTSIGIMIPKDVDEVVLEILVSLLHGVMKEGGIIEFGEVSRSRRSVGTTVSGGIVKGAYYISKGIVFSAEKASQLMTYSTPYVISKLQPTPPEQPISGNVKTSIEVAKTVSGAALSFTGFVADKVGCATMKLGRFLAPHIQKHGSSLLASSLGMGHQEANEHMSDILLICAGAVEGFGTVYSGLEKSAGVLGNSLSDNTVKIVEHRYGEEAGSLAKNGFDTVGNVINLSRNFNYVTPKGFAKAATKGTGKAVLGTFASTSHQDLEEIGRKLKPLSDGNHLM